MFPPKIKYFTLHRRTLSVPVIDGINWNDFGINPVYAAGSHSRGLFEWGMLYKEGNVPSKEEKRRSHHSEPYYAPTHAGGLFAINREYFKELGWYDPGNCLLLSNLVVSSLLIPFRRAMKSWNIFVQPSSRFVGMGWRKLRTVI